MARSPRKIDRSIFTPDELKKLADEAQKEHEGKKKAQAVRDLKAELLETLERAEDPTQQTESVYIDLPPYADRLIIDGTIYMHGGRYDIPSPRVAVIYEQISRAWNHQHEVEGKRKDYHKARGLQISNHGVTSLASFGR